MINRRIGAFIATLRKEQNLTQEQFAEKLGVSNRSVSRWENGNTLPDLSLMHSICNITGITLSELLSGARQTKNTKPKDIALLAIEVCEREKQAKKNTLNLWFSLGLIFLLTAFPVLLWSSPFYAGILILLGLLFYAIAFFHNNRDCPLTPVEKTVLVSADEDLKMTTAEAMVQYAKKAQKASFRQYRTAFQKIAEKLSPGEYAVFTMVAEEFSANRSPGIWHAGIAVTQNRVFLCGETIVGRFMTRTVMDIYDKKEILCVQYTNRSILMKTTRTSVTIRGENTRHLAEDFKRAIQSGV